MMASTTVMHATKVLDNRGSDCATGFLRLLEMFNGLSEGETLRILSSDPASQRELRDWAGRTGHEILETETTGPFWRREFHYLIRKGGASCTEQMQ
ncbi:MAG: sulfurtransferase TusA family protein [Anaerolineales bacterium]|nr:sulfurtransferase TusA family protein [Anaerolineales bacterium]MCB0005520.1 sulfurtransferase TusA family protein [Anaerolineales bacterium]MCB0016202.1 sulfurtransferase TusA family protein [Anaerolineales bacterium]MCB0026495.1 sulfurtransferase TusA family protein [Anaerolineales bacterium]